VSTVLIHAVALPVLEQLIHHATTDKPHDDAEVSIVKEGMSLAEVLVSLADEQNSRLPLHGFVVVFVFYYHFLCCDTSG